jgi:hypothetical protein
LIVAQSAAQEAEALREKRARLIKAQAELDAAEQLRAAADTIMRNPGGLELRRMQMIKEVGAEQNTMTIVMMPRRFVPVARALFGSIKSDRGSSFLFLLHFLRRTGGHFAGKCSSALTKVLQKKQGDPLAA